MSGRRRIRLEALARGGWAALLGASLVAAGPAPPAHHAGAATALTLDERLRRAGRAEARFDRLAASLEDGPPARERGRLVLERPDRVALEFPRTGERLTLRSDGGEWLQPRLRQLIVFGSDRTAAALRWWRLLMQGQAAGIQVEPSGPRRLRLGFLGEAGPDSAMLEIDRAGLPLRLEISEPNGRVAYEFQRWTFGSARGPRSFRLSAPPGFQVIEMP